MYTIMCISNVIAMKIEDGKVSIPSIEIKKKKMSKNFNCPNSKTVVSSAKWPPLGILIG